MCPPFFCLSIDKKEPIKDYATRIILLITPAAVFAEWRYCSHRRISCSKY